MIKKDAVINIKVGVGFLKKIQEALIDISSSYTEEEMDNLKNLIENKEELPEPWMNTVYTLSLLIRSIEEEAINQNLTYEEDVDNIITGEQG